MLRTRYSPGTSFPRLRCSYNIGCAKDPAILTTVRGIVPALSGSMGQTERRIGSGRSLLIDDAATVLGVSRRTVYYRIQEGRLKTIRTRCGSQRVLVSSIEALLREGPRGVGEIAHEEMP